MKATRAEAPAGIVTMLFTDIEGSSDAVRTLGADKWEAVLEEDKRKAEAEERRLQLKEIKAKAEEMKAQAEAMKAKAEVDKVRLKMIAEDNRS